MRTSARSLVSLLTAAAFGFSASVPAFATDAPLPLAAPAAAVRTLPQPVTLRVPDVPMAEPISVALNKSTELVLPAAARDVIVGNPDIADVVIRSPTQLFVVGRAPGQTNIIFRDNSGRTIGRAEVDVHVDAGAVADALRQVLPDETGIRVAAVGDSIFLTGTARSDSAAATAKAVARRFVKDDPNLVTLLRVANEQQVMLRVKVAEMKKTALKELGFSDSAVWANGKGAVSTGTPTFATIGGATLTSTGQGQGPIAANGVPTTFLTGTTTQSAALTASGPYGALAMTGLGALAGTLTMLEQRGLAKTLVEPNLTAVSGETASLLVGGELPIPISAGLGAISIDYKKFGIGLNFTPVVLDGGNINLKLQAEVSAIDKSVNVAVGGGTSVPGLTVRRASSVVEMPSGGSIMIAGLLQNDITQAMAGLPGLMDVPVLGTLFRSESFLHNESELVVIVSSYVVQPVSAPQMALPTDGFAPASDFQRYLMGRLQSRYVRSRELPASPADLQGPVGYIVH